MSSVPHKAGYHRIKLQELFWLKTSSASIQTSLIHSRRELVIMVQAIENWERDDLGFPLRLWS